MQLGRLNKQNFVKGKITKHEGISFAIIFIMIKLIYVKITVIAKKGMASDALTLKKHINEIRKSIH